MRAQTLITARTAENAPHMLAERVDCWLVYTGILEGSSCPGPESGTAMLNTGPGQQTTELSVRNRHERSLPVDAAVGAHRGVWASTLVVRPQQTANPSARNPHEWSSAAYTPVNIPEGAPFEWEPQQTTDPSVRNPHEVFQPADTAVNFPGGGSNWP